MTSDDIRSLRGERTRAAFAGLLGVSPLTVYRWELPAGAPESRRPRGRQLAALEAFAAGREVPAGGAAVPAGGGRVAAGTSRAALADDPALAGALVDLGHARWQRAEDVFLSVMTTAAATRGTASRLAATIGIAQARVLGRLDARGAFTTLLPVLAELERAPLAAPVAARAHVVAALIFGAPDETLFDLGKVNAHAERARALLGTGVDPDLLALARVAQLGAVAIAADAAVLRRLADHAAAELRGAEEPVTRCLADEARALAALGALDPAAERRHLATALEAARAIDFAAACGRLLARSARRALDEAAPEATVLARCQEAKDALARAACATSWVHLDVEDTRCQVLTRAAKFEEAAAVVRAALASAERAGLTPYPLAVGAGGLWLSTGNAAESAALAERLAARAPGSRVPESRALALHAESLAHLLAADAPAAIELARRAAEAADQLAASRVLALHARLHAFGVAVTGQLDEHIGPLGRALEQRLERWPVVWFSAFLHLYGGIEHADAGRLEDSARAFDAALSAFELVGDVPRACLARAGAASCALVLGEPGAEELMAERVEEVRRRGIVVPPGFIEEPGGARNRWRATLDRTTRPIAPVAAPRTATALERAQKALRRLAVRGLPRHLVRRELHAALAELLPRARLGEALAASGAEDELEPAAAAPVTAAGATRPAFAVDIADAGGRGLRVAFDDEPGADERALAQLLATVGGLALEVAALRAPEPLAADTPVDPEVAGGDADGSGFVAVSPAMVELRADVARLGASRATVFVTGESGSGKEVVARALHERSTRARGPFVTFNCAAVPRDLFEAQLFGHRRGAFTGATADNPGVIREADGGTLFVDEIGELPLDVQPKLLRFLENGEVLPLGERTPRRVDVRIVCATHRDLSRWVEEGRFREDLYYRLYVVPLRLPPLRERREDILPLARLFILRLTPPGQEPPALAADARAALLAHDWPGNVRELRNAIDRAMAFAPLPRVLERGHLRLGARSPRRAR